MTSSYRPPTFQSSARPVDTFVRQSTVPLIEDDGFSQLTKALSAVNPILDMYMDRSIEEEKKIGRNRAIQEELDNGEFGKVVTDIRKKKGEDAANQAFSSIFAKKAYGRQKAKNAGLKIDNILTTAYQRDTIDFTDDDGNTVTKRLNEIDPTTPEFNNWYNNKISSVLNSIQNDVDEDILDQFFFPQMQKAVSKLNTHAYKEYNTFVKNQLMSEATVKIKENSKIFIKAQKFSFRNPEAKKLAIAGLQEDFKQLNIDMRNAGITGSDATKLNEDYISTAVNIGKLAVAQGNYQSASKLVNFLGSSIPGSSPGKTLKDNPKWLEKTTDFFADIYEKEVEIALRPEKLRKAQRRNSFNTQIEDYRNEKDPIVRSQKYEKLKLDYPEKEFQTDIDEFGVLDNKTFTEKANEFKKQLRRGQYLVDGEPDKGSAFLQLDVIERLDPTPDSESQEAIKNLEERINNMKGYAKDIEKFETKIMNDAKSALSRRNRFQGRSISNKDAKLLQRYERILQDEADERMDEFEEENNRPMTLREAKEMYRDLDNLLKLELGVFTESEAGVRIPQADAIGKQGEIENPFTAADRKKNAIQQSNQPVNQSINKTLKDDSFDIPKLKDQASNNQVTDNRIVSDMTPTGLGGEDGALIAMARINQNTNKENDLTEKEPAILRTGNGVTRMETNFPIIYNLAKEIGIKFPEVVAAQFGLESAHGEKESGKNNYLGIKATQQEIADGKATLRKTKEIIDGKEVLVDAYFKNFDSIRDMLLQYKKEWNDDFLDRKGTINVNTAEEAVQRLKDNKYATDPDYVKKVISVIKSAKTNPPLF